MKDIHQKLGEYYDPDDRWEMFRINSRDEYTDHFVLKGKYHKLVPETVQKAHRTAEYLMAHAWYYWPMYDEALKKMTHIFEIAIKQKAKQLGIDLKEPIKSGKSQNKSLNTLIKEIHKKEPKREILDSLMRSKNLRNVFAHPTHDSWMGGMQGSLDNIFYYMNVINSLYMDYTLFNDYSTLTEKLISIQSCIGQGLYRLTIGKDKFLIHRVLTWEMFPSTTNPFLFIAFQMVTSNTYQSITEGFVHEPIQLGLKDTMLTTESFSGISLDKGETIVVDPTDHPKDHATYHTYLSDLEKLGQEKFKQMGDHIIHHNVGWAIERLKYRYLWDNYTDPETGESE